MATNVYPTMDSVGFITDARTKAERLLADYLGTNFSQSNIFHGRLKSLVYAVKNNTNDMSGLGVQVTRDLEDLFNAYLDGVTVDVQAVPMKFDNGTINDGVYELQLSVQFMVGGVLEELAKSIQVENTGLARLVNIEKR